MVASILRATYGDGALATRGNFNNDIGLPLTLLRLRESHRAAVVELGMNHPGEIAQLAGYAMPTVAVVNNAQREHQEFMHTVRAVAEENGQAIAALGASGVAVFPANDEYTGVWQQLALTRPCVRFGDGGEVNVRGAWQDDHFSARLSLVGTLADFKLHIAGAHNLRNAAAAAACAHAAGVGATDIAAGLEAFRPVGGRSDVKAITLQGKRITLVDDSYNANPDSVRAAIDVLASLPGPRVLVLGDMGEVGDQGPVFHAEVGAHAAALGIEHVLLLGEATRATQQACANAHHFADIDALLQQLQSHAAQAGSVLVKGSRFMKMERATQFLIAQAQYAA
jgi:UDP-N-acetylmuramoyl-tripeptide--D-alanyl-D-alanine ligase